MKQYRGVGPKQHNCADVICTFLLIVRSFHQQHRSMAAIRCALRQPTAAFHFLLFIIAGRNLSLSSPLSETRTRLRERATIRSSEAGGAFSAFPRSAFTRDDGIPHSLPVDGKCSMADGRDFRRFPPLYNCCLV